MIQERNAPNITPEQQNKNVQKYIQTINAKQQKKNEQQMLIPWTETTPKTGNKTRNKTKTGQENDTRKNAPKITTPEQVLKVKIIQNKRKKTPVTPTKIQPQEKTNKYTP